MLSDLSLKAKSNETLFLSIKKTTQPTGNNMKIQLDERFLLPDTHAKQTNILHSFPKIYTSLTQNNRNG